MISNLILFYKNDFLEIYSKTTWNIDSIRQTGRKENKKVTKMQGGELGILTPIKPKQAYGFIFTATIYIAS